MEKTAYLILQDGTVMQGKSFGAPRETVGEIVFTTGMTGYLETLTDPSYYGQIILQTFPLIGNYGVIPPDFENARPSCAGYIVKHPCRNPSNFRSEGSLHEFLKANDIPGIYGIDTRSLTKMIRNRGVMNGKITHTLPGESDRTETQRYKVLSAVSSVSHKDTITPAAPDSPLRRVALLDLGAKRGIGAALAERGCAMEVFGSNAGAEDILKTKPSGIMLSNGPGDPAEPKNAAIIKTIARLEKSGIPIFGICLGHQLLAIAKGYKTKKLKFGHRGANQPVKDTRTGRVYITSQNHGYEVVANDSSFISVNDGTCEGLDYGVNFSVQFHPEACGGPLDTGFLFDEFIRRIDTYAVR